MFKEDTDEEDIIVQINRQGGKVSGEDISRLLKEKQQKSKKKN